MITVLVVFENIADTILRKFIEIVVGVPGVVVGAPGVVAGVVGAIA